MNTQPTVVGARHNQLVRLRAIAFVLCLVVSSSAFSQVEVQVGNSESFRIHRIAPFSTPAGLQYSIAHMNGNCTTVDFVRTRSFEPSPGAPSRTLEIFDGHPSCRFTRTFGTHYGILLGRVRSRSINDLGVYRLRCTQLTIAAPAVDCATVAPGVIDICGNLNGLCGVAIWFGQSETTALFDIEVVNDPPTVIVTHDGTNLLSGGQATFNSNVQVSASADDPDGGAVTLEWQVTRPQPTATASVSPLSGSSLTLQFVDERDFGIWEFVAIADDNERERVRRPYSVEVVNQTPRPEISGPTRIPFGTPIALTVSADEDGGAYTRVNWEARRDGEAVWTSVGTADVLNFSTDLSRIGNWSFRVSVTDNEVPALTGTSAEYVVEVFNADPVLTVTPVVSPTPTSGGLISISASAVDPDGGNVQVQITLVQVPTSAGIPVSSTLAMGTGSASHTHGTSIVDAGTWIFEVSATDDEPVPRQGTATEEVVIVVDAPPEVMLAGPDRVGTLAESFELTSEGSSDPDSPCLDEPMRCHATSDGMPPRFITPPIVNREWSLVAADLDDFSYHPLGAVEESLTITGGITLDVPREKFEPGLWVFQLTIYDGEGNDATGFHTIEIVDEDTAPLAILFPPTRFVLDGFGATRSNVLTSGVFSYDPDNILSGDLPGISDYNWVVSEGPAGCGLRNQSGTNPNFTLFGIGEIVLPSCRDTYYLNLTVTDDDEPMPKEGFGVTSITIGTCPGLICIDWPTQTIPSMVMFADGIRILIGYHIDPSAAAVFPYGSLPRLDIFHESDPFVPVFSSTESNVITAPLTPLLVFEWNGYRYAERPLPGKYSIQISLIDHTRTDVGLVPAALELNAIWIEVDELRIASDSDDFIAVRALQAGTDTLSIGYKILGIVPFTDVEWRVINGRGDAIFSAPLPLRDTGLIEWDGTLASGDIIGAGSYQVEIEALRGGASLTGVVRHAFTAYDLWIDSVPRGDDLVVMVNHDDDNLNGSPDFSEGSVAISGETDLLAIELRLDPPIEGRVVVSSTDSPSRLNVLTNSNRLNGPQALPITYTLPTDTLPSRLYLEGLRSGSANLQIQLTPDGEGALPAASRSVQVISLETENSSRANNQSIDIGNLSNSYEPAPPYAIRNSAISNFVDRDARRFYVRLLDERLNSDPAIPDEAQASIQTRRSTGSTDDLRTSVKLFERTVTGTATSNSGSFASEAQVLVTPNLPANADDGFAAYDGVAGPVGDNVLGDRTHKATIDGAVSIQYTDVDGTIFDHTIPVCDRDSERRRVVNLRVRILKNPVTGAGYVTSTAVSQQIDRANLAWAPTCIKFRMVGGSPSLVDAPTATPAVGSMNILLDGIFNGASDRAALFRVFGGGSIDEIDVFFAPLSPRGVTYGPFDGFAALGLNTFILVDDTTTAPSAGGRTLAHELGHALGNTADTHQRQHIFYPSRPWMPGGGPSYPRSPIDTAIDNYRRMVQSTIDESRLDRALQHAVPGDTTSTPPAAIVKGNYVLKIP